MDRKYLTLKKTRNNYWLIFSHTVYALCLFMPAYTTDYYGTTQWHLGLEAVLLGPIGFFAGHFSWAANPLVWFAWHQLNKRNYVAAIISSEIAIGVASTFLFSKKIAVGSAGDFPYVANAGYYLWLLSMFLTIGAAFSESRSYRITRR